MMAPRLLVLAVLALPLAPARGATIDAVLDAVEATLAGAAGVPALKSAMACTTEGCTACPAGSPSLAATLAFDHDDSRSRAAWRHLIALTALTDRAAADAADHAYQGATFRDVIDTDTGPMKALGLQADDLADSAAVYWLSLQEIATNDWHAPTMTVFAAATSDGAAQAVSTAKARLGPLAARLRAALRCDPAVAKLSREGRSDLGYALHLQAALLRALYSATFEHDKTATEAVSDAVEKAVAAKGFDLRQGPLAP